MPVVIYDYGWFWVIVAVALVGLMQRTFLRLIGRYWKGEALAIRKANGNPMTPADYENYARCIHRACRARGYKYSRRYVADLVKADVSLMDALAMLGYEWR